MQAPYNQMQLDAVIVILRRSSYINGGLLCSPNTIDTCAATLFICQTDNNLKLYEIVYT